MNALSHCDALWHHVGMIDETFHRFLRRAALATVIIATIFGATFETACPVPKVFLPPNTDAPPCIEFWLNRYQTLIGVFAALIAAWITWSGLKRQIARSDKQIQLSKIQFASTYIDNLRQRIKLIKTLLDQSTKLMIQADELEKVCTEFTRTIANDIRMVDGRPKQFNVGQQSRLKELAQKCFKENDQVIHRCNHIMEQLENNLIDEETENYLHVLIKSVRHFSKVIGNSVSEYHYLINISGPSFEENKIGKAFGPELLKYNRKIFDENFKMLLVEQVRLQRLRDMAMTDADHAVAFDDKRTHP